MSSKPNEGVEESSLAQDVARVRFQCKWRGQLSSLYKENPELEDHIKFLQNNMADGLWEMEQTGAAPILPDGKVGGNAAIKFMVKDKGYLLVSKSGKEAHKRMMDVDFCVVTDFSFDSWSCEYLACDETVVPTSDTPMHAYVLNATKELNWTEQPMATLHGHALETEEEAKRCGLPISDEETVCSTPEDSAALLKLLKQYAYPEHKVFIRKNHGFILLDNSITDVNTTFKEKLRPCIVK